MEIDKIFEYIKKVTDWFDISVVLEDGAIVIRLKPKFKK